MERDDTAVEIRVLVDKATRAKLLAMAEKDAKPGYFSEFAGALLAKSVK